MVTVRAKHLGNAGYLAASAVDRPFNVTQGNQSVEIKVPAQVTWQSEPYEVGLKASSGLTNFKLEVLTGPAEVVEGNKLKLTGVGGVKLILSEPGDERYRVALVQDEFEVVKAAQTIEFGELADASYRIEPIEMGALASSGLDVSYEVVSVRSLNNVEAWRLSSSEVVNGEFQLPMKGFLPQKVTVKAIQGGSDVY